MPRNKYPINVKTAAAQDYIVADGEKSLNEVALAYGISERTLSRALADMGFKTLKDYKTQTEHELLTALRNRGITSVTELYKLLGE